MIRQITVAAMAVRPFFCSFNCIYVKEAEGTLELRFLFNQYWPSYICFWFFGLRCVTTATGTVCSPFNKTVKYGRKSPHSTLIFRTNGFWGSGISLWMSLSTAQCRLAVLYLLLACDHKQTPIVCAVVTTHTHSLSHTQTHLRHVPVTPSVLWWWLRLFLFNGACIWDAFDNHVHISELSWRQQQAKSDWLCFCLYFSWNKSWMIMNTTPPELAHLRNLTLSGRTVPLHRFLTNFFQGVRFVGQHFNTQQAQGCMNVDIQQTISGRLDRHVVS